MGIDPGFKLTRKEPGILLKQSASKWSPHSIKCSLTGVSVDQIFAGHMESGSLFSSSNVNSMSDEFVQPRAIHH